MTVPKKTGPWLWILCAQYFIVQLIVMQRYTPSFSMRSNTISDLGNTVCSVYASRFVCSPLHSLMNVSFVLLGLSMFFGAWHIRKFFHDTAANRMGFYALMLGGIGTVFVGLFPENTIGILHLIGAGLPFLIGNVGILLLSFSLKLPKWLKYYTRLTGLFTLSALVLYVSNNYLRIGPGGMERVTSYLQTFWLITIGLYCLISKHIKNYL